MRLIVVALLALASLLGVAPAAHADVVGYEAWLTRGCATSLDLVNDSGDEAVFVVTRAGGEPVEHPVAAGETVHLDLVEGEPDPTIAVGDQMLTPVDLIAECGGVAEIVPRPCDGEVDVTMNAVGHGPLGYQVRVAGTLAATFAVAGESLAEVVAAAPGDTVEVWDRWNLLDSLTVPACESPPPVVVEVVPVPQEVAVLGVKLSAPQPAAPQPAAAPAPQLAMTGVREDTALAGVLLVLLGAALVRAARRA